MDHPVAIGFGCILLGGAMQGAFALPMKYQRQWRWENTWLVYSAMGMLLLPWTFALAGVHGLGDVYRQAGWQPILAAAVFGFSWGVGSVFCGLSIAALGIALASAIFLGLAAALGSLIPLALQMPASISSDAVRFTLVGVTVMLAGIAICARAGMMRDAHATALPGSRGMLFGMLLAVASGAFSSTMNFGFVFGDAIVRNAREAGNPPPAAAYPLLAVVLSAGFLGNAGYCVYLLRRNRTWSLFALSGGATGWFLGSVMALLVFGGFVLYGVGIAHLGALGSSAGWSAFLAMMILSSNLCGFLTGEWRDAGGGARRIMATGGAVLILAIVFLGLANRP